MSGPIEVPGGIRLARDEDFDGRTVTVERSGDWLADCGHDMVGLRFTTEDGVAIGVDLHDDEAQAVAVMVLGEWTCHLGHPTTPPIEYAGAQWRFCPACEDARGGDGDIIEEGGIIVATIDDEPSRDWDPGPEVDDEGGMSEVDMPAPAEEVLG